MTDDTRKKSDPPLSMDAIAEDLFGLNIRGLFSILTLWRHPRQYFDAARTAEWSNRFTPSIRLWLSFFALFSALKLWWIGQNESMIGAFADGFANAGLTLPDDTTYEDVGREAVMFSFGLVPILQIITMLLLSVIYTAWGERTTLALRQRQLFAVMIPSASVMPVFLTLMLFVPQDALTAYGIVLALVALVIDFQTGYRGAFFSVSNLGRFWRAALLAVIIVILNTATAIIAQIMGIVLTSQKYGVMPTS
ncbi:MAG: hypothetical protein AAFQ22_12335 [Pseudomonadota bacterium]